MNIYADHIEIFWDDLNQEAQDTIEELLGDNGNYPTWKEKIRQTLQRGACFSSKERGVWSYRKAAA